MSRTTFKIVIEAVLVLWLWQLVWNGNDILLQKLLGGYSPNAQMCFYFFTAGFLFAVIFFMEGMTFEFLDSYGL